MIVTEQTVIGNHETTEGKQPAINDAEVENLAVEVMDAPFADAWLRTPNTLFYGDAPADWLHDGRREFVLNALNAIKYGQYS